MIEPSRPVTWYMSQRLGIPAEDAAVAFSRLGRAGRLGIRTSAGSLDLGPPPGDVPVATLASPRVLTGWLRSNGPLGRLCRTPVEVELSAWSADQTEVGLRPRRLPAWAAERYFERADAALRELARAVLEAAERASISKPDATAPLRRAS